MTSLLEALAADEDVTVRSAVAENPATPSTVLSTLAADKDKRVRIAVAENPSTSSEIATRLLTTLAKDDDWSVRAKVAHNPSTPLETLQALAREDDVLATYVSYTLGSIERSNNSSSDPSRVDEDTRSSLSWSDIPSDPVERGKIALDSRTPSEILGRLAVDEHFHVRFCVVRNPSTPPDSLHALASDEHAIIRRALAQNPSAFPEDLMALRDDTRTDTRRALAANPSTPVVALRQLIDDPDFDTRWEAVRNPNCPTDILEALVRSDDPWERAIVARLPAAARCISNSASSQVPSAVPESVGQAAPRRRIALELPE